MTLHDKALNVKVNLDHQALKTALQLGIQGLHVPEFIDPLKIDLKVNADLSDAVHAAERKGQAQLEVIADIKGIRVKQIDSPVSVLAKASFAGALEAKDYDVKIDVSVNDHESFHTDLKIADHNKLLTVKGPLNLTAGEYLIPIKKKALQALTKVGGIEFNNRIDLKLAHPFATIEAFDAKRLNDVKADVRLASELGQPIKPSAHKEYLRIKTPIKIENVVDFRNNKLDHRLNVGIDEVGLADEAGIQGLNIETVLKVVDPQKTADVDFDMRMHVKKLVGKKIAQIADAQSFASGIKMALAASAKNKSELKVRTFDIELGKEVLHLGAIAEANAIRKDAQSSGEVQLRLDRLGKLSILNKAKGRVDVEWDLTALALKKFSAAGRWNSMM